MNNQAASSYDLYHQQEERRMRELEALMSSPPQSPRSPPTGPPMADPPPMSPRYKSALKQRPPATPPQQILPLSVLDAEADAAAASPRPSYDSNPGSAQPL
ncbi:hypothetical protein HDU96_001541, partial [Phlyctochytrium bullatum]